MGAVMAPVPVFDADDFDVLVKCSACPAWGYVSPDLRAALDAWLAHAREAHARPWPG